jgi:glycosyltransferase involved in cell wall biosynthesis
MREAHGPPLVSLALPVYNGERFLSSCLQSLVEQTYDHCEIIISDNASTDGTQAICREFVRRNPRMRYVRAERNRGAAWNHNRVLELAHGSLFKWCGADDTIEPRFIEACVAALTEHTDAVLAYPRTLLIDDAGEVVDRTSTHLAVDSPDRVVRFGHLLSALHMTHNAFYGVMRTDAVRRVRPLRAMLAADRCLLAELALAGRFVDVQENLLLRRQHHANVRRSATQERDHYDPERWRPLRARELGALRAHVVSVLRSPLDVKTKARLLELVAVRAFHKRHTLAYEIGAPVAQSVRQWGRWLLQTFRASRAARSTVRDGAWKHM